MVREVKLSLTLCACCCHRVVLTCFTILPFARTAYIQILNGNFGISSFSTAQSLIESFTYHIPRNMQSLATESNSSLSPTNNPLVPLLLHGSS